MKLKIIYISILSLFFSLVSTAQTNDTQFQEKIKAAAASLAVPEPAPLDPVSLNAQLVYNEKKTQAAVIIKGKILKGWQTYASVPSNQPYIQTELELELPQGAKAPADWNKPRPFPYEDGIFVYRGDVLFTRIINLEKTTAKSAIKAALMYQCCNSRQCLQPKTKTFNLNL